MEPQRSMEPGGAAATPTEVTTFVQGLLNQMQQRFNKMSDNIISKVDEMGVRLDGLEKNVNELIEQAGGPAGGKKE